MSANTFWIFRNLDFGYFDTSAALILTSQSLLLVQTDLLGCRNAATKTIKWRAANKQDLQMLIKYLMIFQSFQELKLYNSCGYIKILAQFCFNITPFLHLSKNIGWIGQKLIQVKFVCDTNKLSIEKTPDFSWWSQLQFNKMSWKCRSLLFNLAKIPILTSYRRKLQVVILKCKNKSI